MFQYFEKTAPLWIGIGTITLVMALGLFSSLDLLFYKNFSKITPALSGTDNQVLIVDVPLDRLSDSDETWLNLLAKLRGLEARQIVFSFMPQKASSAFYASVVGNNPVLFGIKIQESPDQPGVLVIEKPPAAVGELKLTSGVLIAPNYQLESIYTQYRAVTVGGISYPAMEHAAAVRFGMDSHGDVPYYINIMGSRGAHPNVRLERVLSGGLIPELVKGKTVLVGYLGPVNTVNTVRLNPGLSANMMLSPLEFHGYALDTLLSGKPVRKLPLWANMLLAALIVFIGFLIQGIFENRLFLWVSIGAILIYLIICWLLLAFARVWIQPVDILFAFGVTMFMIFRQRGIMAERTISSVMYSLNTKLKQRSMPESFHSSSEYWSQVISLVNQTLQLSRGIFLEKIPNDHRVREVKSLNCSIADIRELRRDYQREPYTSAIEKGGAVRLVERLFLIDAAIKDEEQYLVPLVFGGQTLGFWAFGIQTAHVSEIADFDQVIRDFSGQISELLFRREEWQQRQSAKDTLLATATDLSINSSQESLLKAVALMERRHGLLDSVFHGLASATILYDLFGRVLYVNQSMTKLLAAVGVAPYQMTALDLIAALTGEKLEVVRTALRQVLLERDEISFVVKHDSLETSLLLKVRHLLEIIRQQPVDGPAPLSAVGFLLEIVETTVKHSAEVPAVQRVDRI